MLGLNRIGNMLVPNSNYCKFEDWIMPILNQMLKEQQEQGTNWTPSKVGRGGGTERWGWCCCCGSDSSLVHMTTWEQRRRPTDGVSVAARWGPCDLGGCAVWEEACEHTLCAHVCLPVCLPVCLRPRHANRPPMHQACRAARVTCPR